MKSQNIEKVQAFLRTLNVEGVDIPYHIDVEEIDIENPFESIREQLEDGGAFDIEIIYYSRAIEFLTAHDPSLRTSLQLAEDMGYTPSNLSSEILASLLAGDVARDEFNDYEREIETFFEEIKEDEEAEEDEEENEDEDSTEEA